MTNWVPIHYETMLPASTTNRKRKTSFVHKEKRFGNGICMLIPGPYWGCGFLGGKENQENKVGGPLRNNRKKSLEKDLTFFKKMIKKEREQKEKDSCLMNIEVRLFANFRDFLPPGTSGYSVFMDVEEDVTIGEVLKILQIPETIPMITLINGIHRKFEDSMHGGDVLSLFPPVAGG